MYIANILFYDIENNMLFLTEFEMLISGTQSQHAMTEAPFEGRYEISFGNAKGTESLQFEMFIKLSLV